MGKVTGREDMIRWEFKFTITEFHLIFALIFTAHLALMGMKSQHSEYIVSLKEEQQRKIKAKLKKEVTEEELLEAIAGKQFKREPFVITYLGNVKLKRHSELLSLLQSKVANGPAKIVSSSRVGIERAGEVEIESDENVNFELSDEQKKNLIKRLIKERMAGVEVCKRQHLLQDEFLMGTIKVNMKIKPRSNLAVPRFNGHGNRKVIKSLENCVQGQFVSMSFPNELSNEEITFDVRVN